MKVQAGDRFCGGDGDFCVSDPEADFWYPDGLCTLLYTEPSLPLMQTCTETSGSRVLNGALQRHYVGPLFRAMQASCKES